MADPTLAARTALGSVVECGRHGTLAGSPGVIIGERAGIAVVSIMARKDKAEAAAEAARASFGATLPLRPCRVSGKDIAFIWSGPERWIAIAPRRSSEDLAKLLGGALSGLAAVAEQGDGRVVIRIAGQRARDVLAKVLAIDLHPRAFRAGDTAVTGAAHLEVQIWQLDDGPTYELMLFRGFAQSFWHWLTQSAAEYGYEVVGAL